MRGNKILGFLDPQINRSLGNKKSETQTYITIALKNRGKQIYIAPYIMLCSNKKSYYFSVYS